MAEVTVFNQKFDSGKTYTRINTQIKAETVRLVDFDGTLIGIVPLSEALTRAQQAGLDLIEIAPLAQPPVCKIFPYDKFKYEQQRKLKESKKKQKDVEIKEIRLRPNIFQGDLDQKVERMKEFLDKENRVKVVIQFQGRELAHRELGRNLLDRIITMLEKTIIFDKEPKFEGRNFIAILAPEKRKENAKA